MPDAIAIQTLKTNIQLLRQQQWPPHDLTQVSDLPIYHGSTDIVQAYFTSWKTLIARAQSLYEPLIFDQDTDAIHLPSHLNLPLFYFDVSRIRINKTLAKESKTFRSVASVQEKCGQFLPQQLAAMQAWLQQDVAALVAHREFIDLRTYVFQHGQSDYSRCRFYLNGIVLAVQPTFKVIDVREKPRKPRSDRYLDPLADNGLWKVYGKYR